MTPLESNEEMFEDCQARVRSMESLTKGEKKILLKANRKANRKIKQRLQKEEEEYTQMAKIQNEEWERARKMAEEEYKKSIGVKEIRRTFNGMYDDGTFHIFNEIIEITDWDDQLWDELNSWVF